MRYFEQLIFVFNILSLMVEHRVVPIDIVSCQRYRLLRIPLTIAKQLLLLLLLSFKNTLGAYLN